MGVTTLIDVSFSDEQSEVIDLDYLKRYMTIETDTHDVLLNDLIKSARTEVEKLGGISIVEKTIRAEWEQAYEYVRLPYPKIKSITSLKDGESTSLDITNYNVRGQDKKTIYGNFSTGLVVEYVAGYGDDTPEDLKLAIAKKVSEDFEQRTGIALESNSLLPNNWRPTVINYRPTWMMF